MCAFFSTLSISALNGKGNLVRSVETMMKVYEGFIEFRDATNVDHINHDLRWGLMADEVVDITRGISLVSVLKVLEVLARDGTCTGPYPYTEAPWVDELPTSTALFTAGIESRLFTGGP